MTVAAGGSNSSTHSSAAASTAAVRMRLRSDSVTRPALRGGLAEAPLAAGKELERLLEVRRREIRPQARSVKYSSAYARSQSRKLLMRCSPPVRISRSGSGQTRELQAAAKRASVISSGRSAPLAHFARELLRGLHDVPAAAVAHRHLQLQRRGSPAVRSSAAAMRACRRTARLRRSPMKRTRTPLRCSSASLAVERLDEQTHEAAPPRRPAARQFSLEKANSVSASMPRRAHSSMHRRTGYRPALWPAARVQTARGRPAAVAVHDDRDVARQQLGVAAAIKPA